MPGEGREEGHRSNDSIANDTTEVASTDRSADRARRSGPATVDAPPSFGPDAIVGDRYRVVRFLARGGMGEVYEAEDATLRQAVALKVIASEVAEDQKMIARLKREVLLARKVTHPNVCRLHDLGFHTGPAGTMPFLTMDLLRGETLASHLGKSGPMSEARALPLVKHMASALDAAHAAGVIHRDFKSRNVMLVKDAAGEATRAVVTDFGIAVATEDAERHALDTGEGKFVGTPAYMAPEQVSGGALSPATDVYALGVVLFEMVTGTLPFTASRALEAVTMRLTQPAPSPRSRVPSLDRRWDRVILKCLERDPARRFASAGAVAAELARPPAFWTRGRAVVAAGVVIALGIAAAAQAYRGSSPVTPIATAGDAQRRPTLAVLSMANDGKRADVAWVATALTEMLGTDLDADEALRVIPASRVATAQRELSVGDAPSMGGLGLARVRENLGLDYVINGRYAASDDGAVRVELALVDARSGEAVARATAKGSTDKLVDVASSLGDQLRATLGAREPTAAQRSAARAASPGTRASIRKLAEAETKLNASDYAGALADYEEAVKLDPASPMAHFGVAEAAQALGYDQRALEESRLAFETSRGLSREKQLLVEGRYRATNKEWERAIETARTLFEFFPDEASYAPPYLHALVAAGRAKEALAVIDRIHAGPPPTRDDPRVDLYEAIAASHTPDVARQIAACQRAIERGQRAGALSVVADGHMRLGRAYAEQTKWDDARAEYEKARALYVKMNDRVFEASVLADIALLDKDRGDAARAMPLLEQSLEITRAVGLRFDTAGRVLDVATVAWMLGDLARAHAMFEEARGLYEAIHDPEWGHAALGRLGLVLADEGDLAGARRSEREARASLVAANAEGLAMAAEVALVELDLAAGDVAAATATQAGLAKRAAASRDPVDAAAIAATAAALARETGDLPAARRQGEEARRGLAAAGLDGDVLQVTALLARVALDEGRAAEAAAMALESADMARPRGRKNDEARALACRALALVALGDRAGARAAIDRAVAPTSFAAQVELAIARVAIEGPRASAPLAALNELAQRAESAGFAILSIEARLAASPSRADRARIASAAQAQGLTRVARRARP